MPNVARISVNGRPPQREFSTYVRPNTPPHIKSATAVRPPVQISASLPFQKRRMPLHAITPTRISVAISGRHCSSKG
ncbi:hypothetical protein D3C71_1988330 [compost metagenome]